MGEPICGGKEPLEVEIKEGQSYWWCSCGRSQNQPLCDGSHAGSGCQPLEYIAKRDRSLWLCTCKLTKKPPFCDGSHNAMAD